MAGKHACGGSCGCGDKTEDPYAAQEEAVWHDPTSYDPIKHGPGYMPDSVRLASSEKEAVQAYVAKTARVNGYVGMAGLLMILRAAAWIHQSHHWQTRGPNFYGDHLLFERLYNESLPLIDQVAEKSAGLNTDVLDQEALSPKVQAHLMAELVTDLTEWGESMVDTSLRVEAYLLKAIDAIKAEIGEGLTQGTDNLIQGVADVHEGFVYLLQQRAAVDTPPTDIRPYSYDFSG